MTVCCTRLQSDVRLFNCVQGWRDEIIARKERENKAAQGTKREREREREQKRMDTKCSVVEYCLVLHTEIKRTRMTRMAGSSRLKQLMTP